MPKPDPRNRSRSPGAASRRPGERASQRGAPRTGAAAPSRQTPGPASAGAASSGLGAATATVLGDADETLVRAPVAATPSRPRAGRLRPRITGRAAVLVLVLAVLTVSFASSLKAYLQQRAHIADLKAQITQSEAEIDALEREKARWQDPAFVQSQARARFGYLMPGQTSYVVLDADGKPLESESALSSRRDVLVKEPTAWWETVWGSVELAGNPPDPADKPTPATHIEAPPEETEE